MKKLNRFLSLFFMIFFLCLNMNLFAQPHARGIMVGGQLHFKFSNGTVTAGKIQTDEPSTTEFLVAPMGGYFVNNNFGIGAKIGYFSSTKKDSLNNMANKDVTTMFSTGAFVRAYYMVFQEAGLFLEGSISVLSGNRTETSENKTIKTEKVTKLSGFEIGIMPAIVLFVTQNIGLEIGYGTLNYNKMNTKMDGFEINHNEMVLSLNPETFKLGVQLMF